MIWKNIKSPVKNSVELKSKLSSFCPLRPVFLPNETNLYRTRNF